MEGLNINLDGKKLIFAVTGDVFVDSGTGEPQIKGTWDPGVPENQISYSLDNVRQTPLDALYSFNSNNQLVVKIRSGQTASDPFTFPGRIELDRNNDIVYVSVDRADGVVRDSGPRFLIDVKEQDGYFLEPKTNALKITMKNGLQAKILGETPEQALEASENPDASLDADDLLMYQAVTRNTVAGVPLNQRARLNFPGQWDINNGQLVFVAKVANEAAKPDVKIGFAGRFKAVTAGFVYFADKTTKNIALNIRGQHVFKSDDTETHFDWETSIGYTGKRFRARMDADLKRTTAKGGILDLRGALTLNQDEGKPVTVDLSLQARYQFDERNMLVFSANIGGGDRPTYDLMLTGTFVYSNLQLTFSAHYSSAGDAKDLTVEIGIQGDRNSMVKMISLIVGISEQKAKLMASVSFSVRMRFANGIRVKDEPVTLPAVAGAGN